MSVKPGCQRHCVTKWHILNNQCDSLIGATPQGTDSDVLRWPLLAVWSSVNGDTMLSALLIICSCLSVRSSGKPMFPGESKRSQKQTKKVSSALPHGRFSRPQETLAYLFSKLSLQCGFPVSENTVGFYFRLLRKELIVFMIFRGFRHPAVLQLSVFSLFRSHFEGRYRAAAWGFSPLLSVQANVFSLWRLSASVCWSPFFKKARIRGAQTAWNPLGKLKLLCSRLKNLNSSQTYFFTC